MTQALSRVLRIPCADPDRAAAAANYLRTQQVDVLGSHDRHVLVPAGTSPVFVWDLAEALADYGHDDELARWAADAATGGGV